jgi:mannose-6-phosphate isomerase
MKPLKFQPLLKSTIWGGSKIFTFKHLDVKQENVGESWEISGVPGNESIVADGEMQGKSLNEVVAERKGSFLGEENYKRFGNEFPLLIKFIDANRDLSIQVHPNDEIAKKQGKERGKTEMWYALPCEPDAKLYNGLKMQITPEQYKEMVENDTITDALAQYNVKEDDCFFIPAGRIHTIGTGCFVVEIQQTSDVTYRIYDFKRKDKDGNYRQLHTKEAAECIDYTVLPDYRQHYTPAKNQGVSMVQCPYFTTAVYDLDEPMTLDYSELDSFVILIGLKGEAKITDNEGNEITLQGGESLNEVVAERKGSFLGEENYKRFGNEFPLLIKFIDANRDLSIQVHPNDEIAKKQGKERGKTEMWYALPCEPDAKLYNGLKMQITPEQYKEMVENDTITDALAQYNVKEDDCFFIPAGRIHTIGTGCFVVEIQQTSDVTYRIYDFKRKDKDGNYRQLHTKEAAECIDYTVLPDYRQHYTPAKNQGVSMVQCPYFTTAVYDLDEPMTLDYSELDSFVILIGLKGEAKITDNEGNEITLQGGESIVVPASTKTLKVEGTLKFLEVF